MDVDTTSGKWSHHQILERVERREVDILLGTQMIAKGLDFPNVTLVGVVNADVGINLPDFRATERTFQLLTQVAGRAGRGDKGGEVIVQTSLPEHYAIVAAQQHDFEAFAERELVARREPLYPPFCRLVNIVVSGVEESATQEAAQAAADWLRGLLRSGQIDDVDLIGPAPCPIDRIARAMALASVAALAPRPFARRGQPLLRPPVRTRRRQSRSAGGRGPGSGGAAVTGGGNVTGGEPLWVEPDSEVWARTLELVASAPDPEEALRGVLVQGLTASGAHAGAFVEHPQPALRAIEGVPPAQLRPLLSSDGAVTQTRWKPPRAQPNRCGCPAGAERTRAMGDGC